MTASLDSLALLLTYYFEQSKQFAYWTLGLSVLIYLLGVAGVILPKWKDKLSTLIIGVTVAVLVLGWMSAGSRSEAERLKRHQEFVDGLGVPVSVSLLTDAYVGIDPDSVKRIASPLLPGTTFASPQPRGPSRLLESIGESAWFSAKIATTCAYLTLGAFVAGIVFAMLWMHGTLIHLTTSDTGIKQIKRYSAYGALTGGLILFLLSIGVLQSSIGYFSFARAAEKTEEHCKNMVVSGNADSVEALTVVGEYQVSRAGAPFLPTFVYLWKRDQLNQLWNLRRKQYQHP